MSKSDGLRRATTIVAGLVLAAGLAVLMVVWEARPAEAAFPGANGKIAFVRIVMHSRTFGTGEVFKMNPDGSNSTRLTGNTMRDWNPAWAPDGQKIAYAGTTEGEPFVDEIFIMNPNGDRRTRLTHNPSSEDSEPAWSPDGQKIAFASDRDGPQDIYVMDTDPSTDDATNLTETATGSEPAWSPDGQKIAFTSDQDIYVMDTDPSTDDATNLTNTPSRSEFSPNWSPSGGKIAFVTYRDANPEIFVMNKDGSGLNRLTNNEWLDSEPAWSPNGRKIAFARDPGPGDRSDSEIFVMNPDGSRQEKVTDNTREDSSPDWQPIVP